MSETEPPVLDAYRDSSGGLQVWCDHERVWHRHSGDDGGHRAAHCRDRKSPYNRTGYTLRVAGQWTPKVHRMHTHKPCSVCHREMTVTAAGLIRVHGAKEPGVWPPRNCAGSRQAPAVAVGGAQ